MLEVLTNHVWIHEVFDPKGPLLKIKIDYPLAPGMEHDTPDSLLGRRMRKARQDLLNQLSHGSLRLWPSKLPPAGHVVRSIQVLSSATAYFSSYCIFMTSSLAGKTLENGGGVAWNIACGFDFEPHTTTLNRTVSLCSALMHTRDYIRANSTIIFGHCTESGRLKLACGVSRPCLAAALDPHMVHRNIVGRDIYQISKKLLAAYPIDVLHYCTHMSMNIGSVTEGPVAHISLLAATNSNFWRTGASDFLQDGFPEEEAVFLNFTGGELAHYSKPSTGDQSGAHQAQTTVSVGHSSASTRMYVVAAHAAGNLMLMNASASPNPLLLDPPPIPCIRGGKSSCWVWGHYDMSQSSPGACWDPS